MEELKKYSLSAQEVLSLIDGKANFITYPQLKKVKHIDEILTPPYYACIILTMTGANYGHFTCLFKLNNNTIEFFDPYNYMIDDQLKFNKDPMFRKAMNQDFTYLTKLLADSGYKITYNHHKFQEESPLISTCGRHVATRLMFKNLSLKKYHDLFKDSEFSPDDLVTQLTYRIIGK